MLNKHNAKKTIGSKISYEVLTLSIDVYISWVRGHDPYGLRKTPVFK